MVAESAGGWAPSEARRNNPPALERTARRLPNKAMPMRFKNITSKKNRTISWCDFYFLMFQIVLFNLPQLAVLLAVAEINYDANNQPHNQTHPVGPT